MPKFFRKTRFFLILVLSSLGKGTCGYGQGFAGTEGLSSGDVVLPPEAPPRESVLKSSPLRGGATLGVQFPHLWDVALEMRIFGSIGLGVGGGKVEKVRVPELGSTSGALTHVGVTHVEGRVAWFPWAESFFIGFLFGHQKLEIWGSGDMDIYGFKIPLQAHLKMSSSYITPHFGWQKIFPSGFVVGSEIGIQLPFEASPTFSYTLSTHPNLPKELYTEDPTYKKTKQDVEEAIKIFGQTAVPYWKLIKIGVFI